MSIASSSSGAAAAVAPARIPASVAAFEPKRSTAVWILGAVLLLVVVWVIEQANRHHSFSAQTSYQASPVQPQPQLHTQSTGNVAFTVNAASSHYYQFPVPSGALSASLKGLARSTT
jgi:hypothetical protein